MDEKLYVLIREDLTPPQQAVQAGHAVAEYLLRVPGYTWTNGTLVYLGVQDKERLRRWGRRLEIKGIPFAVFKEPDLGNTMTALAAVTDNPKIFQSLRLAEFALT